MPTGLVRKKSNTSRARFLSRSCPQPLIAKLDAIEIGTAAPGESGAVGDNADRRREVARQLLPERPQRFNTTG